MDLHLVELFRQMADAAWMNGSHWLSNVKPEDAVGWGKGLFGMAKAWLDKRADKKEKQQLRADIEKLAGLMSPEVIRAHVEEGVRQYLAARPATSSPPTADEIIDLELFIEDVPTALRKALARPDDPTGTTVPYHFPLDTPEDVAKVLPPPPLGFRPGVALPGISGWVLVRKLGRGGFGEVWLARHTKFASLIGAVKFFPGESGRALVHEAELIDRVRSAGPHNNIVPLINVDLDGPIPWIMFEFVDGLTLAEWVRALDGKPAAERLTLVLNAFAQICDGVAFLHGKAKVVHGDLKPANVLVCGTSGTFRITDLGIGAVAQEANDGLTRGGRRPTSIHGAHTPIYTSPQQQKGDPLDPRDDVHALGVIGYQMLTGKLDAGPGSDAEDDMAEGGAPAGLIVLVKACTANKPDRRPKDAEKVLEKLKALLSTPHPPEPTVPTTSPAGGEVGVAGVSPSVAEAEKPTPTSHPAGEVGTRSVPGGGAVVHLVPLIVAEPKLMVPTTKPVRTAGDKYALDLPGGAKMAFAWCPPGTFVMGSPKEEHPTYVKARQKIEQQHEVRLTRGFFAGVHPVTRGEFAQFVAQTKFKTEAEMSGGGFMWTSIGWHWDATTNWRNPGFAQTDNHPVTVVSWNDAVAFCKWFADESKQKVRLPTEAEWEYACRGGTTTPFYWGGELNGTQANTRGGDPYPIGTRPKGPYLEATSPVGSYANIFIHPWGLADVHGNVYEWCTDLYDNGFYGRSPKDNPECQESDQRHHVCRGGAWGVAGIDCRAASRTCSTKYGNLNGFRVVFCLD